jgi:hypothetical protein
LIQDFYLYYKGSIPEWSGCENKLFEKCHRFAGDGGWFKRWERLVF